MGWDSISQHAVAFSRFMFQRNVDTLIQIAISDEKISHLAMVHESQWFSLFYFLIIMIIKVYGNYHWVEWVPGYTDPKDLTWPSSLLEAAIAEKKELIRDAGLTFRIRERNY